MNIEEKEIVNQLLVNYLVVDESEIRPDKNLEDLGADSLDLIEIVLELEHKFSISIPDEMAEEIITIEDLYRCIDEIQNREKD